MALNRYTDRPKRKGTARTIWDGFKKAGFQIHELHYNPNCWGAAKNLGWGTWAFSQSVTDDGFFCGVRDGRVYIQGISAPFVTLWCDTLSPEATAKLTSGRRGIAF